MQPRSNHPLSFSSFELWCVALCSLTLLLGGDAKILLARLGLVSSADVVGRQLSGQVTSGLSALDSLSLTPGLVTLIVWGAVGMVIYSFIQALQRASASVKDTREVSSNRFIHPKNFDRRAYWRQVLVHTGASFGLLLLLALLAGLYLFYAIPVGFYYTQVFIQQMGVSQVPNLLLGLFVVLTGTTALYYVIKLVRWQRR
jgi:uncharacterized BrkB/YihY/UPF0761 family membrane protein